MPTSEIADASEIAEFANEVRVLALMLLISSTMKDKKEQSRSISVFLTGLFLVGCVFLFWVTMHALKTGVAEIPSGTNEIMKTDRVHAPEDFWVCVLIYAVAGLGCVAGFVSHARKAARKFSWN